LHPMLSQAKAALGRLSKFANYGSIFMSRFMD